MSRTSLQTTALESLQSTEELGLLDTIDSLRSQGVSHYISLPQLIVCGDQSSGKSSVLEAISGIPFPTKDNLCTRFATELILRRASAIGVSVSIVPSQDRSEAECHRLVQFHETLSDFDDFPILVEKAKEFMGMSATSSAFSNDVLRVEVSGPSQQHLTIVDLPGLIHSENKLQTSADVALVLSMVQTYMANRRSIILAVVSAKNDYANQIVTKLAKDVDSKGFRTLGIITKPDTLPIGSESELAYANLARNQDVEFRLGWHVLRNRDYESRNTSVGARDTAEEHFFSQGIWRDFSRNLVGITSLRTRLSQVLLQQIKNELPNVLDELEASIKEIHEALGKLGTSRDTNDEQRLFLLHVSQSFQSIINAAIDGTYGNSFFGDPRSAEGYSKRLRAVIQNLNMEFAERMRVCGHKREIVDRIGPEIPPLTTVLPQTISRATFLDEVTELLKISRGRELPGMFNPLIVGDLFHEQSLPWERLAQIHLKNIWEATRAFLELAISHLTDDATTDALLREVLDPLMEQRYRDMTDKLVELLLPHQKGHPITYNHYFIETIQNMRERRLEAEVTRKLSKFFGGRDLSSLEELPIKKVKTSSLISALSSRKEADMEKYASSEILDCMQAYYKVALKSVIDSIAIQAIETQLLGKLGDLLSPARVVQMKSDMINKIAAESSESRLQRERMMRKLVVLKAGLEMCKKHIGRPMTNLQNRPWHSEQHVLEENSDPDLLHEISDLEDVNNQDLVIDTPIGIPPLVTPVSSEPVEVSSSPEWSFGGSEPIAAEETVLIKKTKKKAKKGLVINSDSPLKFL
ncbi:related to vacuolar sorting protein VPS1, dynamin, and related proteins [Rhynchosporium secalis]|uniref:Related to vacuolar sorting protein VPS1, dynamin, and related proteins n=1 Tax=Rhynchosporium secalis TaxID=38038 RepID=A0A1E1MPS6_RHYSE|nr:related to vacuolar sorting protein VPS1, dynamin, and related proteins [Rhynchosporium secalis]